MASQPSTVQNVSVGDCGKAIVANVTQHAEADRIGQEPGKVRRGRAEGLGPLSEGRGFPLCKREAQAEASKNGVRAYRPDACAREGCLYMATARS